MIKITREDAEQAIKEGKVIFTKDARIGKINASEACLEKNNGKLKYFPIGMVEYNMAKNRTWFI